MNPLASRLTSLFERDVEDRINFKSFVSGLSVFSEKARPEVRQRGTIIWLRSRKAEQRKPEQRHPCAAKDVDSL